MSIFIGFVVPKTQLQAALKTSMSEFGFRLWYFSLRFIVPPALIVVMFNLMSIIGVDLIMPMFGVAYLISAVIWTGMYVKKQEV